MRILVAMTVFAFACGTAPKKQGAIVEGAEASPTCCCKTLPTTAEKEIVPNYAMSGRMECSGVHGDCVDDVQCTAREGDEGDAGGEMQSEDGVPPPPVLEPSTSSIGEE